MPPLCIICGEPISRPKDSKGNYQTLSAWNARKLCDKATDNKAMPCWKEFSITNGKSCKGPLKPRKPADRRVRMERQDEIDCELDMAQMRLNIEIDRKRWAACGYISSPPKIFTPEEIEAIRHTITIPT